ncbi:MAG: IclR family transcriptional regulator [Myxococcota bacterium]
MAKSSSKPKSDYAIQTVLNAFRMLEVFDGAVAIGVSDVARSLGLHKNNAFRLLATLEIAGYVQQSADSELYHLGPRCLELAHAFARNHPFASLARPVLEELVAETGETAHLGVLRDHEVAHLDGVLPSRLLLTGSRVGERLPAHCTALGKALLVGVLERPAASPIASPSDRRSDRRLDRIRDRRQGGRFEGATHRGPDAGADLFSGALESFTDGTITDGAKLLDEVRASQLRGYALDLEEYATGLHCVAAPVRDASERVIAAISISGPSQRLGGEQLHGEGARAVAAAAHRLSRALGAREVGTRELGAPEPAAH